MSNVWGTRYRLLQESMVEFANQLSGDEPPGPAVAEEYTVRLLAAVLMLLEQHQVNKRGQCTLCGWTRWKWRFWRHRRRCTVYQSTDFAMGQELDVVWWQLLTHTGQQENLSEVREWMAEREESDQSTVEFFSVP